MLYSLQGQYPKELPFRIRLSNGLTKTDPSTFTTEDIADAGYVAVSAPPSIDDTQILSWSSSELEWVVTNKSPEQLALEAQERADDLKIKINDHRNYLISKGFKFNNIKFDSRPEDQKRINGSALLAFMAVTAGAQEGDYYWHGGSEPFTWITKDNFFINMDAQTVIEFGKVAAEHERAHVFAARTLKDMNPIPSDYDDPSYWPVNEL